jgi:zinc protease
VLNDTLRKFIEKGPTQAELDAAKANLIGGFPLRIDSNSDLVSNLTMMGLYGMPLNYLDTWTDEIAKVTLKDAREAFARHVNPDKLTTVVVGGQE